MTLVEVPGITQPVQHSMAVSETEKTASLVSGQAEPVPKKKSKKSKDGSKSKSKSSSDKSSKKKRKTAETSETVPTDEQPKKKKKKSKAEPVHSSSDSEDTTVGDAVPAAAAPAPATPAPAPAPAPVNPLSLDNFRLSAPTKSLLRAKNMETLFDIQAQTLNFCLDGFDLVGRARTGCGKTLAFVLPIVETLTKGDNGNKRPFGRTPRVIVLAPTRELAKQVCV